MILALEIIAVVLGLLYLYFLIKENIICWYFGVAGSLVSIFLFYQVTLYSEAILYLYYVVIGIYGFYLWKKQAGNQQASHITNIGIKANVIYIFVGALLSATLGYIFDTYTDASNPYLDATTTVFSFIASYLEARRILVGWIYWIVINGVTLFLYLNKDLNIYVLLTLVYFVFSFIGYREWRGKLISSEKNN